MELLIMAAGMGSRFGGLKQITPIGPHDEFLIDYSIYDAIKAGFTKVIFIIKEENYNQFKETIGSRVEPHIPVEYVFQKMDNIPEFVDIPKERVKPWGTAQAIYCAKDKITSNFIVINADDFYGSDAYYVAAQFLKNKKPYEYATIAYEADKTLAETGAVKRGVISCENNVLTSIKECSINKENNQIIATPLNGEKAFEIEPNQLVSMNMLAFDKTIFPFIEEKMNDFFKENKNDLTKCEFLIPDILNQAVKEKYSTSYALNTSAVWYGITYKEDINKVQEALKKLTEEKVYPENLWR